MFNLQLYRRLGRLSLSSVGGLGVLLGQTALGQVPPRGEPPDIPEAAESFPDAAIGQQGRRNGQPTGGANQVASEEMEYLTRGPLHEAFATPYAPNPTPAEIIAKEPPEPIVELAPEYRPEGQNVEWISGYWLWDEDQSDFIWISGVWRDIPPKMRWVPGYWEETQNGYRRIAGFWADAAVEEITYLPPPPESLEQGPSSPQPAEDHFYLPGHWVYQSSDYIWQPGAWSQGYDDWIWVPSSYVWTPRGCIYRQGYWDYEPAYRGVVFTPVHFRQPLYRQPAFRYQPRYVVNTNLSLLVHLFVRPQSRQYYYFGNYYGNAYAGNYQPWIGFHGRNRAYDPLYTFYSVNRSSTNRNILSWVNDRYRYYEGNARFRPAPTVSAQTELIRSLSNTEGFDSSVRELTQVATTLRDLAQSRSNHSSFQFRELSNKEQDLLQQLREPNQALSKERYRFERSPMVSQERGNTTEAEPGTTEGRIGADAKSRGGVLGTLRLPRVVTRESASTDNIANDGRAAASQRGAREERGRRGSGEERGRNEDRGGPVTVQRPDLSQDLRGEAGRPDGVRPNGVRPEGRSPGSLRQGAPMQPNQSGPDNPNSARPGNEGLNQPLPGRLPSPLSTSPESDGKPGDSGARRAPGLPATPERNPNAGEAKGERGPIFNRSEGGAVDRGNLNPAGQNPDRDSLNMPNAQRNRGGIVPGQPTNNNRGESRLGNTPPVTQGAPVTPGVVGPQGNRGIDNRLRSNRPSLDAPGGNLTPRINPAPAPGNRPKGVPNLRPQPVSPEGGPGATVPGIGGGAQRSAPAANFRGALNKNPAGGGNPAGSGPGGGGNQGASGKKPKNSEAPGGK